MPEELRRDFGKLMEKELPWAVEEEKEVQAKIGELTSYTNQGQATLAPITNLNTI